MATALLAVRTCVMSLLVHHKSKLLHSLLLLSWAFCRMNTVTSYCSFRDKKITTGLLHKSIFTLDQSPVWILVAADGKLASYCLFLIWYFSLLPLGKAALRDKSSFQNEALPGCCLQTSCPVYLYRKRNSLSSSSCCRFHRTLVSHTHIKQACIKWEKESKEMVSFLNSCIQYNQHLASNLNTRLILLMK